MKLTANQSKLYVLNIAGYVQALIYLQVMFPNSFISNYFFSNITYLFGPTLMVVSYILIMCDNRGDSFREAFKEIKRSTWALMYPVIIVVFISGLFTIIENGLTEIKLLLLAEVLVVLLGASIVSVFYTLGILCRSIYAMFTPTRT